MTGRKDKCHRSNLAVNPSLTVTQVRKKQLCSKCTGTEIILRLFWIVVDMVKSTPLCRQTTTYPWQCAFSVHTNQQLNINMWTTVSCNCDIDEVDKTSLFKLSKADTCINLKTVRMLCFVTVTHRCCCVSHSPGRQRATSPVLSPSWHRSSDGGRMDATGWGETVWDISETGHRQLWPLYLKQQITQYKTMIINYLKLHWFDIIDYIALYTES